MIYYGLVFLSAALFTFGLRYIQRPFFHFAYSTSALLNTLLNDLLDEDSKQKQLISKVKDQLLGMFFFIFALLALLAIACVPVFIFIVINNLDLNYLETNSVYFYGSMSLGSVAIFLLPSKKQEGDYSELSKLLHRMILDHAFISKQLFYLERRFFLKRKPISDKPFVLVTGLARAGTTALTQVLYNAGQFHSLSYANMPFLLAPNLWAKFYRPKSNEQKERAHGDNLQFGYETIEALEEQFFKVFTHDEFVGENALTRHTIDQEIAQNYLDYQRLVAKNNQTVYLAKNNNLILRYPSLKEHLHDFHVLVVVRNPFDHAQSLLKQHLRFSELHEKDEFALNYMNWLGHHEFGKNHKPFELEVDLHSDYPTTDINYWLSCWVEYYSYLQKLLPDPNIHLIDYGKLAERPNELLKTLSEGLNLQLKTSTTEPYRAVEYDTEGFNSDLKIKANELYQSLSTSFM